MKYTLDKNKSNELMKFSSQFTCFASFLTIALLVNIWSVLLVDLHAAESYSAAASLRRTPPEPPAWSVRTR